MGLWSDRFLPRAVDRMLGDEVSEQTRARVVAGLTGDVLELGFGSGRTVAHYGPGVRVLAVEPNDVAWRIARKRIAANAPTVVRAGLDGQRLDLPDDSVDAAVSTWTLCTIPDPVAALREVRRVLRPGGVLRFADHGAAPAGDEDVRRRQRRWEPLQKRVGGGCHLTREIDTLVADAGFTLGTVDRYYLPKAPRPWAAMYEGNATYSGG